ncbi:hypothetical protein JTB14_012149 [Gonioctena quinquepunctata]|nr:hypothetical protein JTB14_012149 [Gonioctena quinquepunctata]
MLPEEFRQAKLLNKLGNPLSSSPSRLFKRSLTPRFDIPKKVDWRKRNTVNEIETQGSCGACWAFSVIGVIESMIALKTGKLEKLSVQQMIDCSRYTAGCEGGDICSLLAWIKTESISIVGEKDYPLALTGQQCKNISGGSGVLIDDYECNSLVDAEDVILTLLARHGPVAVALNAQTWQHYVGGTIQFHCDSNSSRLNHAVQIVGYDLTAKIPHYIVRNSWGEDFGERGYMYIGIGGNLCGLAHEVTAIKVL